MNHASFRGAELQQERGGDHAPGVAPGRRTLTMGLPPRAEPAAAPVQAKAAGEPGAGTGDSAYQRQLFDAALRPDLHAPPALLDPERTWSASEVRMAEPVQRAAVPAGLGAQLAAHAASGAELQAPGAAGKRGVAAAAAHGGGGAHVDGGQIVIDGDAAGAVAGSSSMDQLGTSLAHRFPFERYRVVRDGGAYAVEGKLNPWVRIVDGLVAELGGNDQAVAPPPAAAGRWEWAEPEAPVALGEPMPAGPFLPRALRGPQDAGPDALPIPGRPHQTPGQYVGTNESSSLFRGIRGQPNGKRRGPSSQLPGDGGISAPPDGNMWPVDPHALEATRTAQHRERSANYLGLYAWDPAVNIQAADPTANEPVVRQVAGDNTATQYISSTKQLLTACRASAYNWAAAGGLGGLRLPRKWGPIIHIDVRRLPRSNRVFDLSDDGPHRDALFREVPPSTGPGDGSGPAPLSPRTQPIAGMASRDDEVLIDGGVPGTAIIETFTVAQVMSLLHASSNTFLDELRRKVCRDDGQVANEIDRQIITMAGLLDAVERPPERMPERKVRAREEALEHAGDPEAEKLLDDAEASSKRRQQNARRSGPRKKMTLSLKPPQNDHPGQDPDRGPDEDRDPGGPGGEGQTVV